MNFKFSNDSYDLDNLDDLLSTEVVESEKSKPSSIVDNNVVNKQNETSTKEIQVVASSDSLPSKVNKQEEEVGEVEEKAVGDDNADQVSNDLDVVSNLHTFSYQRTTNSIKEEDEISFRSTVLVSDTDLCESNSEGETLVTVSIDNIKKKSDMAKDESVVFMGWKNENSGSVISDVTSIGGGSLQESEHKRSLSGSAMSGNKNQLQNTLNRLARNRTFSGPEKTKKNIWKGVMALTQRSPINKKGSGRKEQLFDSLDEFNCKQNEKDEHNVIAYETGSDINVDDPGKYVPLGINDDDESGQNDDESVNEKEESDSIKMDKIESLSSNDCNLEVEKQGPESPPSLHFKERNSDEGAFTFHTIGVTPATTPINQQKKKFGRNMKIQPTGVKLKKKIGLKSNLMNEDIAMQKEFVQIQPFYAYPEGFQMSDGELYQEMIRKSSNFETLVSSQLSNDNEPDNKSQIGTLKVEVLACMGLPQFRRSKPNPIAYLVCGDSAFETDAILNSRTPMWPARSKRAALFPLYHAYARLYAGIFSVTDKDNDDYAGRVAVDIAALRPNVDYDVTMPLRKSGTVYDRQPRGLIRIRVRLEWTRERAATLSYLPSMLSEILANVEEPYDLVTIPCADTKSIRNVALTIYGEDLPGK